MFSTKWCGPPGLPSLCFSSALAFNLCTLTKCCERLGCPRPGASQSVRSAGVPYSREAMDKLLRTAHAAAETETETAQGAGAGGWGSFCKPWSVSTWKCNAGTGKAMADAAYRNACADYLLQTRSFDKLLLCNIFGVSCTVGLNIDFLPR